MMQVPIQTGATLSAATPQVLFEGNYFASASAGARGRTYDVTADGKRFVMVKDSKPQASSSEPTPFTIVLNWFELRRVAPPAK